MTSIRKLFFLVLALTLTAFALPSSAAPAKIFGLTMDTNPSGNFIAGQVNTISATYTNLTPNGNSTINWVHLSVPKALWGSNPSAPPSTPAISFPEGGTLYSVNTSTDPVEIVVNNIPGIGSGGAHWKLEIKVYVPSSPACMDYVFGAQAFTGNSGTQGQPFAYQAVYPATGTPTFVSKPDIAVVSGCTLGFINQPASATVNTTITSVAYDTSGAAVQVGVYSAPSVLMTSFNGPITLAITSGTGTAGAGLSGGGAVNAVAGVATFAPSINTAGINYQLNASLGGSNVDSNPFWITAADGTVNCSDSNYVKSNHGNADPDKSYIDFSQTDEYDWGLRRGANTNDLTGANCIKVGVSLTIDGSSVATFVYDKTVPNQQGNFKYWIVWPETKVNPKTTSEQSYDGTQHLTASYGEKRPLVSWNAGTPIYVPALNCASDQLNQGTALMPILPDVSPFNDAGQISDYKADGTKQAKVCIAEHVMIGTGKDNSVPPNFFVIYADKIVDQVDTFVKQP